MEEYASVSWSEIVEREITHYRKPGEFAQMHEKLSSPSRKRFVPFILLAHSFFWILSNEKW